MNLQDIYQCERRSVDKFAKKFLLPEYFRRIGIGMFVVSLASLLGAAILTETGEAVKLLLKNVILISLTLIALAKEPFEDEFVEKLRGQAFSFAFVSGIVFALFQP
ncbi:MAG: hypothetical protein HKN25_00405, partial [Pyrinomonadaceae bacterium]|nr:hypothetical protein [Pyrinomonadaceae bacterium]